MGVFYLSYRQCCVYYNNNMITCSIPGRDSIEINHLVFDMNGTLALDGELLPGVAEALTKLKDLVEIHIVSSDTYGKLEDLQIELRGSVQHFHRLQRGSEAEQKLEYVEALGPSTVAAIGQGTNDRLMLKGAGFGVCVVSPEGTAVETMLSADVLVPDILSALGLFLNLTRLKATLRQ